MCNRMCKLTFIVMRRLDMVFGVFDAIFVVFTVVFQVR
jgi:hypothetical protein